MFNQPDKNPLEELLGNINDPAIIAQLNDQRLAKVAEYDITQGHIKLNVTQELLQTRFAELKRLAKTGEMSLKQIENDIYTKWGVQDNGDKSEPEISRIGFSMDNISVLDIEESSKDNH